MVATCQKCHPGATRRFAGYLSHATHHDPKKYPWLFWTFWGMTGAPGRAPSSWAAPTRCSGCRGRFQMRRELKAEEEAEEREAAAEALAPAGGRALAAEPPAAGDGRAKDEGRG